MRDYFPTLIVRQKWHVATRNVKLGGVVLVQDSNVVRGRWRLAEVISANAGFGDVNCATKIYRLDRSILDVKTLYFRDLYVELLCCFMSMNNHWESKEGGSVERVQDLAHRLESG